VRFAALLAIVACALGACGGDDVAGRAAAGPSSTGAAPAVRVVTTTTQLTDFARVIGGDRIALYDVVRPNVDPHDYEPSPADLEAIASADVTGKNGVDLERWFDDTIASASPQGTIVDASEGVAVLPGDDEDPAGDPHIWHDPRNAKVMVHNVAEALAAADPVHQADYKANEAAYDVELDRLDRDIAAATAGLANKRLVTNHDAFGYYVDRYGLEFEGAIIPSFDTQAELSARDLAAVVRRIRATGVKAVFSETSMPPKTAEAIGRDAGVDVVAGDDALYGDALGGPGSDAGTYLEMERHNTREIVDHLR